MTTHPAYPRAWQNPVDLRPSAALEAAGAWDTAPVAVRVSDATRMSLALTYTRGGAGGAFDWYIEISYAGVAATLPTGAAEWDEMALYASGPVAAGADSQSRIQMEFITFQPLTVNAETFTWDIELDGTVERVRILARESGAVGTPGTLQVTAIII